MSNPGVFLLYQLVSVEGMNNSLPFPCKDRRKRAPEMSGIILEALDRLQPLEDSLCMFGGAECRFEDAMAFIRAAGSYQFIFGSSVWFLPARLTPNTTTSAPLREVQPVVVGRKEAEKEINSAISVILRPFSLWTWLLIVFCFVLAVFVRVALAQYFARPRTRMDLVLHLLSEFSRLGWRTEHERLLNLVSVRTLKWSVAAAWVILILFYEISVVEFIFQKATLTKELGRLTED